MTKPVVIDSTYQGWADIHESIADDINRDQLVELVGDGIFFRLNHERDSGGTYQVGLISIHPFDQCRFIASHYGLRVNSNVTFAKSHNNSHEWKDIYLATFLNSLVSPNPKWVQIPYAQFLLSKAAIDDAKLYIYDTHEVLTRAMIAQQGETNANI
jgi:hypothetical protein